jgi:hypothetical protein
MRIGDPKLGTSAVGTGETVGRNRFRRAAPNLPLAPGHHRHLGRGGMRLLSRWLAAGWAIVGGARLEQPLGNSRIEGAGMLKKVAAPGVDQQSQDHAEYEPAPARIDHHSGARDTISGSAGACRKDSEEHAGCQSPRE